jgi:DNA-binding CsgD family transcriptional regulator
MSAIRLRGSTLWQPLSPREQQVRRLLQEGKRPLQIAALLGINHRTVSTYLQRIDQKTGAAPKPLPKPKRRDFNYRRALRAFQRRFAFDVRRAAKYRMAKAAELSGMNRTAFYAFVARVKQAA